MEEKPQVDTIFGDEDNDKNAFAEINFDIDTGRWLLKVIGGPNNGAEVSMHAATSYVIGTDPNSCDIVFHDTSVSRQHARISVGTEGEMSIEDLKSRNGTIVDGEAIKSKAVLYPNSVVTLGTSSFTIYDREGEMQTIISPLLPSIVKTLQKEEVKSQAPVEANAELALQKEKALADEQKEKEKENLLAVTKAKDKEKAADTLGALIVMGVLTGLFVIIGLGTATLFKSEPVAVEQQVDPQGIIEASLKQFPSVTPYYNRGTGKLQLIGHVNSPSDKMRLIYSLQGLPYKELDDSGIIIDEYVWKEINQVLSKNPNWKGIAVQSTTPGKFILSGYLQTRSQAEQLYDYIATNFPYLDLLERRVIVEEDVAIEATNQLRKNNLREVSAQVSNNEITLTGKIARDKQANLQQVIAELEKIPGIRDVKSQVVELEPEQAVINITDKYDVTGISKRGSNFNVVIHGHILSKGDELDGMTIKEIRQSVIFLEREGVLYRIDFSR